MSIQKLLLSESQIGSSILSEIDNPCIFLWAEVLRRMAIDYYVLKKKISKTGLNKFEKKIFRELTKAIYTKDGALVDICEAIADDPDELIKHFRQSLTNHKIMNDSVNIIEFTNRIRR